VEEEEKKKDVGEELSCREKLPLRDHAHTFCARSGRQKFTLTTLSRFAMTASCFMSCWRGGSCKASVVSYSRKRCYRAEDFTLLPLLVVESFSLENPADVLEDPAAT